MSHLDQDEAVAVSRVHVRLIRPGERAEWDRLMQAHHYLGLTALVGRSLRVRGGGGRPVVGAPRLGIGGAEVRPA